MLLTYGNEKETLENFVKEMTDTLGSIRNAAQEENRKKMSDAIHHARSSWMMVQSDESLNHLFDLIEDSTSSDDVINHLAQSYNLPGILRDYEGPEITGGHDINESYKDITFGPTKRPDIQYNDVIK